MENICKGKETSIEGYSRHIVTKKELWKAR